MMTETVEAVYTDILNDEEKCFEKLSFIKVVKNNTKYKDRLYKNIRKNLYFYSLSFWCIQRRD